MFTIAFLLAWLAVVIAPDAPIVRPLRAALVERPARWLGRITRGHVLLAAAVTLLVIGAVMFLDGDLVRMAAMAAPDALAWATMFDVAALLDGALVAVAVASAVRWRGLRMVVGARLRGRARPRRRRNAVRPAAERPAANDDEDRRAMLRAA